MASEWNLPHDIIVQILSRLPVKSLLQFRCVCKSWCSLISDSHFVKTHLSCMSRTDEDDDYKHYKVIFNSPCPNPGFESCSLYSVLYEPYLSASEPDYPLHLKDSIYWAQIMASCNVSVFLKVLQQYSGPLCISKNGEILFKFGSLVIYDLKEGPFRYPSISFPQPSSHSFCASLYAKTYFESLVSPSADNELQEYH
ncbi:F-box/kelch-repeat protein At3g23880-like [Cornus florida]|uniref:F-box/kelch-repeat protein At3g23880-like n=1 Tax=Cornus florida TaxID=4283 RepID=UPI00289B9257|nr:F-box/kelch-repeat protein At3g23880-like [Cornus florida]